MGGWIITGSGSQVCHKFLSLSSWEILNAPSLRRVIQVVRHQVETVLRATTAISLRKLLQKTSHLSCKQLSNLVVSLQMARIKRGFQLIKRTSKDESVLRNIQTVNLVLPTSLWPVNCTSHTTKRRTSSQ